MFTPLTFILAGNYEEFVHYCQSRDLNRHDFVYLNKTAEGLLAGTLAVGSYALGHGASGETWKT